MNKPELNRQIFEAMLKSAVNEEFERKLKALPPEKGLAADCELSPAAKSRIERAIRESHCRSIFLRAGKTARRVAVLLAVIIPVALGSLLSVEASRNAIFNALMEWKSDHIDIRYQENGNSCAAEPSSGFAVEKPQYLPEGFFETQTRQIGKKAEIVYQNSKGIEIKFNQIPLSGEGIIGVDTIHTTRTEIEIQGEPASLFTADSTGGNSYLIWENHLHSFMLYSKISPKELIKIAESIGK